MKRTAENYLERWIMGARRKPLILRGARQVGKSTLVRNFCKSQQKILVEINFERFKEKIFDGFDTRKILQEFSAYTGKKIEYSQCLLFLDEIQEEPKAIEALRYFYEQCPDLPVIAAGSLLEFALKSGDLTMPVGRVEYFFLGPMTLSEFLVATGNEKLWDSVCHPKATITQVAHRQLLDKFKEFLFVGGMPEAVLSFKEEGISAVPSVHRSIVLTYQDDFPKYSKRFSVDHIGRAFEYCALNVGSKIVYNKALADVDTRTMKKAMDLLFKAKIIMPAYHSPGHLVPISGHRIEKIFKTYFLDVGLANSIRKIRWKHISSLDNSKLPTLGFMVEQFVAQHLFYQDEGIEEPHLEYWLREGKMRNAEVDFLIEKDLQAIPIEVKAKKSGALRSLHQFVYEKETTSAIRLNLNLPIEETISTDISTAIGLQKVEYNLNSLPAYLIETLLATEGKET